MTSCGDARSEVDGSSAEASATTTSDVVDERSEDTDATSGEETSQPDAGPSAADLAAVLPLDPFAEAEVISAQDDCVVDVVIASLGLERLASFDPAIAADPSQMWSRTHVDERVAAVEAIQTCAPLADHVRRGLSHRMPERVARCAAESTDTELLEWAVQTALLGEELQWNGSVIAALNTCIREHLDDRFGPEPDLPLSVRQAILVAPNFAPLDRYDLSCVRRVIAVEAGQLPEFTDPALDDADLPDELVEPFRRLLTEATVQCFEGIDYFLIELRAGGIAVDTTRCLAAVAPQGALDELVLLTERVRIGMRAASPGPSLEAVLEAGDVCIDGDDERRIRDRWALFGVGTAT